MKIKKITLLIVTLLNIFCAQELVCAAAAGAGQGNLEAQVVQAAGNLYDNAGNINAEQKKQLDDLINRLDVNQIKNILANFRKSTIFEPQQDILIQLLLKKMISLGRKILLSLEKQDLIWLIQLARTLEFDRNINIKGLHNELENLNIKSQKFNKVEDANPKEQEEHFNKVNNLVKEINLRQQFIEEINKKVIPDLEAILKYKLAKDLSEKQNMPLEEALKTLVMPKIERTEESCVIA